MRFKIDENLPAEIRNDLRVLGHEADTVTDEGLAGVPDASLLAKVQVEGRILLTQDKGIANIRAYPPQQYSGIVLFRPRTTGRKVVLSFVRQHMAAVLQLDLNGHLVVVSESGMRIR
jgi:predicted nuclease of predicted toxin-antitoxin system